MKIYKEANTSQALYRVKSLKILPQNLSCMRKWNFERPGLLGKRLEDPLPGGERGQPVCVL